MTYNCNNGFGLNPGFITRTCGGNGTSVVGIFDGSRPTCDGVLVFSHCTI